jgi:hypothetical protein
VPCLPHHQLPCREKIVNTAKFMCNKLDCILGPKKRKIEMGNRKSIFPIGDDFCSLSLIFLSGKIIHIKI